MTCVLPKLLHYIVIALAPRARSISVYRLGLDHGFEPAPQGGGFLPCFLKVNPSCRFDSFRSAARFGQLRSKGCDFIDVGAGRLGVFS